MGKHRRGQVMRIADQNPTQVGWATPEESDDPVARASELLQIEMQKRQDQEADAQRNNPPAQDIQNPVQTGWATGSNLGSQGAQFTLTNTGNLVVTDEEEDRDVTGRVYLTSKQFVKSRVAIIDRDQNRTYLGRVAAVVDSKKFAVQWDDGTLTDDEDVDDYELVRMDAE